MPLTLLLSRYSLGVSIFPFIFRSSPLLPPCCLLYLLFLLSLSIPPSKESIISCVGQIDASRYLLGDANGRLLMLFVDSEEKMDAEETVVTSMRIEVLGEVLIRSVCEN